MSRRRFDPRPDVQHSCLYCGEVMRENMRLEPVPATPEEFDEWQAHPSRRRRQVAGTTAYFTGNDRDGFSRSVYRATGTYGKHPDYFCTDWCAIAFAMLAAERGVRFRRGRVAEARLETRLDTLRFPHPLATTPDEKASP